MRENYQGCPTYSVPSPYWNAQAGLLLEGRFRLITERYTPLMKFLESAGAPLPSALRTVSDFILHHDIRGQFAGDELDLARLRSLVEEAQAHRPHVFDAEISYCVKNRLEQMLESLAAKPDDLEQIRKLEQVSALILPIPMGLNLWKVQNIYWEMLQKVAPKNREGAAQGDAAATEWVQQFTALGERLGFAVVHSQAGEIHDQQSRAA